MTSHAGMVKLAQPPPHRPDALYFAKRSDAEAVTVIFPMNFKDSADAVIARTFLAQFVEARRAASMSTAPACSFSLNAPLELKDVPLEKARRPLLRKYSYAAA